jgi:predicted GIY-YIG superfamily endonuclease
MNITIKYINKMIYILKLEKDKWYVGYTDRPDGERFNEHFTGNGSEWTKKYKPITVAEWRDGDYDDEDKITLELMKTYGWWNVRGGKWCKTEMTSPPQELNLIDETTKTILKNIVDDTTKTNNYKSKPGCSRCGRYGHGANNCYAKTDSNNKTIKVKCTYCTKDFDTANGATYHENFYCKNNKNRKDLPKETSHKKDDCCIQ